MVMTALDMSDDGLLASTDPKRVDVTRFGSVLASAAARFDFWSRILFLLGFVTLLCVSLGV